MDDKTIQVNNKKKKRKMSCENLEVAPLDQG